MRTVKLLDNQLATSDGTWTDVSQYLYKTVNVRALAGSGAAEIRVSARADRPLDTEHETLFGSALGVADIDKPIEIKTSLGQPMVVSWLKVRKTTGGAGTGNTVATILLGG